MANLLTGYREFNIGLVGLAVVMLLFGAAAAARFGSSTDDDSCFKAANGCYCENIVRASETATATVHPRARRAVIKQPMNTWSNLGFILAGLAMLWWIGWERATGTKSPLTNRMTRTGFYPAAFGFMTIFMGPGSMFFHASLKQWGGWLDSVSMYLFMSFILSYNLTRFWNWPRWAFGLTYGLLNALVGALAWVYHEQSTIFFAGLGALALISQAMVAYTDRIGTSKAGHWWFFAGTASFVTAFLIWHAAWTNGDLCVTRGFQGHAVWHVLSAFTVFSVYKYFRAESLVLSPLPAVLRIFVGIAVGGGVGYVTGDFTVGAFGGGDTARLVVAIIVGVVGATYAAIALAYQVYTFRVMSIIGLVLDVSWSILNSLAGLVAWIPAALASGGKFQTPDANSKRSGSFVYDKNPRGGGFGATTIGTVIGGGWSSHEEVHVWQARIFGPAYMLSYLIAFVLNLIFRLLTFRKSDLIVAPYYRVCFEDWAYWAGATSGAKIKWGGWVGGFFLSVLYVGLIVMIVAGAVLSLTPLLVVGIVALALYSLIRALLPGH